jgi:hypothetical protein
MTPRPQPRPKRSRESGYAMLLVFLMAAMIAIALYNELPRVAFEAQRTREQLLIERGEQYKRAIQVFVRKMNRYPASIEELENTNNFRFLRKRYIDPMTGKDKWRLIHINGGVVTDSIVPKTKPGQPGQDQQPPANTNTFIAEGPVMGATNDPSQQQINPAMRRRQSDDRPVAAQEVPDAPPPDATANNGDSDNGDNSGDTPAPGTAGTVPVPGMPNQQTPGTYPGRQPGMYPPTAYPGQPGFNPAAGNQPFGMSPGAPNQMPGMGTAGGFPNNSGQNTGQNGSQNSGGSVYVAPSLGQAPSAVSPTGFPGQPGSPGQPGFPTQPGFAGQPGGFPGRPGFPNQQGGFSGQPQPAFSGTSPGGFGPQAQPGGGSDPTGNNFGLNGPSAMQPQGLAGMGGQQLGGGIAGVASVFTGPAIKVYNERKKYNEWEFIYDKAKDRGLAGVQGNGGAPGTPAQAMGSMPGQQPGMNQQPGGMGGNGFGASGSPGGGTSGSIFTPSTGFGQSTPQQPQPQPQPQPQQPQN